jgi:hypothetical protein
MMMSKNTGPTALAFALGIGCAGAGAVDWDEADDWQSNALFEPSARQLERERAGWVTIYDGLTDRQVARALDTQFHRVEAMMFVNVVQTDDVGEPLRDAVTGEILSDSDCD